MGGNQFVFSTLGASNHVADERAANDYYATDPRAMEMLLQMETFAPVIVGLFHDLCKLEAYESTPLGWTHTDTSKHLYTGHGEKSVLMLAPWMQLTAEEVACIRWHMGAFDDREQWSHYTAAIHQFPNVLWTHQADMIAAHILQR